MKRFMTEEDILQHWYETSPWLFLVFKSFNDVMLDWTLKHKNMDEFMNFYEKRSQIIASNKIRYFLRNKGYVIRPQPDDHPELFDYVNLKPEERQRQRRERWMKSADSLIKSMTMNATIVSFFN